jgi:hypothetical protein
MSKREYTVEGVENKNPNNFGGMVSRAVSIKAKETDFEKGIETIATTDAPAMVIDWERFQVVREVLPMRYMEAPNNDKVPLLDSHSKASIEKVKGSASAFTTEGGQLICKTFVSKSEPVIRQKIEEGHIDSVSIGYMTDRDYTVEIPKGAEVNIDGVNYRNDFQDGTPLLVRTWWRVHELSLVPIGADETAKFKSDAEGKQLVEKINALEKEIESLKEKEQKKPEKVERGLTYHEAQVRLLKYL